MNTKNELVLDITGKTTGIYMYASFGTGIWCTCIDCYGIDSYFIVNGSMCTRFYSLSKCVYMVDL